MCILRMLAMGNDFVVGVKMLFMIYEKIYEYETIPIKAFFNSKGEKKSNQTFPTPNPI